MTLSHSSSHLPVPLDQIAEIQSMAENGRFADALLRVRKVKGLSPPNTFLVAIEKQLERLVALPPDTEPSAPQRQVLLNTLPSLLRGVMEVLQTAHGSVTPVDPALQRAKPPLERSEKDATRAQLKEEYYRLAEDYLRKGAYGSALVEIRRVRIIAPDDQTTAEYERIIRQLVELKQRGGSGDEGPPEPHPPPDLGKPKSPWKLGKFWAFLAVFMALSALAAAGVAGITQ